MKKRNEKVKKAEEDFQKQWDLYWHQETTPQGQKKAWDLMWMLVQDACTNIAKSKAYGITIPDLEGKACDATIKIMSKIKEGCHPRRLSSYCFLWVQGALYAPKTRRWEEAGFLDDFERYIGFQEKEEGIEIVRYKDGEDSYL